MSHKQKSKVGLAIQATINIINGEKAEDLTAVGILQSLEPTHVVHTELEQEKLTLLLQLLYVVNDNELFSDLIGWEVMLDDVISQDYERYSQYLTEDFLYNY